MMHTIQQREAINIALMEDIARRASTNHITNTIDYTLTTTPVSVVSFDATSLPKSNYMVGAYLKVRNASRITVYISGVQPQYIINKQLLQPGEYPLTPLTVTKGLEIIKIMAYSDIDDSADISAFIDREI